MYGRIYVIEELGRETGANCETCIKACFDSTEPNRTIIGSVGPYLDRSRSNPESNTLVELPDPLFQTS